MGLPIKDPLHDGFASWALGYAPYGGADAGEVVAIARAIADADDSAYYDAWIAAADRHTEQGDACLTTLVTSAERDPLARRAQSLYDALTCPKAILHFTAAEGAGEHVETMNRSLLNRRVFDWLDGILKA